MQTGRLILGKILIVAAILAMTSAAFAQQLPYTFDEALERHRFDEVRRFPGRNLVDTFTSACC